MVAPAEPPDPPRELDGDVWACDLWRDLWREPVAGVWRPADAALVVRLIRLRQRAELDSMSAPVALFGAILSLESSLLLTPKARAHLPASAAPMPPVVGEPERERRRMSARQRDRLLRG